eukprot:142028-Chlamydomonas_euryale.AAC.1
MGCGCACGSPPRARWAVAVLEGYPRQEGWQGKRGAGAGHPRSGGCARPGGWSSGLERVGEVGQPRHPALRRLECNPASSAAMHPDAKCGQLA